MSSGKIFEYKSDWFNYFESILKHEYKEDRPNQNKIKAHIIESNYESIEEFAKHNKQVLLKKSKERDFHNVILRSESTTPLHLYLDTEDSRFWVIHNIEPQEKVKKLISQLFWESYLQDKIYIPNQTMEKYWKEYSSDSLGMSLKFKQLFLEEDIALADQVLSPSLGEDFDYTLRLWPKRFKTMDFFLEKFKEIGLPINFQSLNYVFQNEDGEIIMKEDFCFDGRLTVIRGKELYEHIKFIKLIRQDYSNKIDIIEDFRIDWEHSKGDLFVILYNKDIDPILIYKTLIKNIKKFRIYLFKLYKQEDYILFDCIDAHTGGRFNLQIFKNKLYIKLKKDSCGNIIFRLFSNLQKYLSPKCQLRIDNCDYDIMR